MAKAQYIGADGVARKVKSQYIGADGVARKVTNGYIGVDGVARQFYSSGFTLSQVPVGNSVYANYNGVRTELLVVNQGIPAVQYTECSYGSSCDGTWLLMKDCLLSAAWHSANYNAYNTSMINEYLNGEYLASFDISVRSAIKQVRIPTRSPGYGGTNYYGENGLLTKLFLLSMMEVGFTLNDYAPFEGGCLSYFEGIETDMSRRVARYNGSTTNWWLRSPREVADTSAFAINSYGYWSVSNCSYPMNIRPAFIMPFDTEISIDGTILV